jgi:snRNA-activating protein complex subunit 1
LTGELKKLTGLVVDAKEKGLKVVSVVVKRMLEKNMFLFGCLEINEGSVTETVNQLTELQNARIQVLYNKYVVNILLLFCIFLYSTYH